MYTTCRSRVFVKNPAFYFAETTCVRSVHNSLLEKAFNRRSQCDALPMQVAVMRLLCWAVRRTGV